MPFEVILHACNGQVRVRGEYDTDTDPIGCATCGAPLLPNQPFHQDHASTTCTHCNRIYGLCAGLGLATDLATFARDGVRPWEHPA